MSRDGAFVVRHENEIAATTDVADRPEFADRRADKIVDGRPVTGWFTEDFTLAELRTLGTRERLPTLRPGNTAWDGQGRILTFQDVIDIARAGALRTGRSIGVAPELKHPSYFAGLGLPMEDGFVDLLVRNNLTGAEAPILIQCFEIGTLERLARRIDAPLLQLISPIEPPFDRPGTTSVEMITPEGLTRIAGYARYIGADANLILPRDAEGHTLAPRTLIADAHALGLKVVAWTLRAENAFLAVEDRRGDPEAADYLAAQGDLSSAIRRFMAEGIDGIFTDHPAIAVTAARTASQDR